MPALIITASAFFPPLAGIFVLSYLVGSIPFGYLAGRIRGIDIREHGSGNIGATNVLRTLGKPAGITVFALDVLKGFLPVIFLARELRAQPDLPSATLALVICGVAVILGHNFPIWLKFKGGKGIATSAGALLPLMPLALLAALAVWIAVFLASRYVSLASLAAALAVPATLATEFAVRGSWNPTLLAFAVALWLLATWRHRANIQRLIRGEENRFEKRPRPEE